MTKKYKINRLKNTIMLLFEIVVIVIGIELLLQIKNRDSSTVLLIAVLIIIGVSQIVRTVCEYKCDLIFNDSGIKSFRGNKVVFIPWNEIARLQYSGTKILPIFNMMTVSDSEDRKIHIDYNVKDYKNAWDEIIATCKIKSPNVCIDERFSGQSGDKDSIS